MARRDSALPDVTHDAVVVVPGIMGSELVDADGRTLWGLRDLRWYATAWTTGAGLRALRLTDEERAGHTGRVRPNGLLRFPAFMPVLAGVEPYTRLVTMVRDAVADPAAVRGSPTQSLAAARRRTMTTSRRCSPMRRRT